MTSAVVVGSGPNGLAAAVTLARAGVAVTVLEAAGTPGGGARSTLDPVSGVTQDDCSAFHPLVLGSPFWKGLGAAFEDVVFRWADAEYGHPLDGGRGAVAYRSLDETVAHLGAGGRRWRRLFGPTAAGFDDLADDVMGPMLAVPRHPLRLARFGLRTSLPAAGVARVLGERAGALYSGVAAHAMAPLTRPFSSAIGAALGSAAHVFGWPVVEGGTSVLTDVLVRELERLGGRVETGVRVRSMGDLGSPDLVMLDLAPREVVDIAGAALPRRVAAAYSRYRHGPGAFKVDFVVDGEVPWAYEPLRGAGTVHVGGSADEVRRSEAEVHRGSMPARPFVLVGQQFVADPSRSAGPHHPLYSYAHVPHGFEGDATEAIVSQIERFAPGFRDRVVSMSVRTTTEMSVYNRNYVGGDVVTGANGFRQLVFRPRVALDPYATGIPGTYLCSAATPPGAGAHGMCGHHAATRALRAL